MNPTETETRGRGRPRQFDENDVLDSLVQLFWEKGFENASLHEIVDTAGLNKSSLYNAFGPKDELFFAAINRYMDIRAAMLDEALGGEGGLELLVGFLDLIRAESLGEGGCRGCLAVNATTELGLREDRMAQVASQYRNLLADHIRPPLQRAGAAGEIDEALIGVYVDTFVGFMISIAVAARSAAPPDEIERQIDSLGQLIESWRI